jgi:polyhydroxyalkanoate synthesis regulator phasin
MWFILQADIEEAKLLPEPTPPEISRMEFDMKDQLVRQTIMTTQEDVKEIKEQLEKLNDKIDRLR